MPLSSELLKDEPRLQACLLLDLAHVQTGSVGTHVEKIQLALASLDDARISADELASRFYGPSTTAAVLAYKTKRGIINREYQDVPDAIVGKMTIARMDEELMRGANPVPPVLPEIPLPEPPAVPPIPLIPPAGFRLSGWRVSDVSGLTFGVPTPIPGFFATGGEQDLALVQTLTGKRANFKLRGAGASVGVKDLVGKLPWLWPCPESVDSYSGSSS
jgi:peptidoglycan hydrolase-like protein with peptidoglycan-binding domain